MSLQIALSTARRSRRLCSRVAEASLPPDLVSIGGGILKYSRGLGRSSGFQELNASLKAFGLLDTFDQQYTGDF